MKVMLLSHIVARRRLVPPKRGRMGVTNLVHTSSLCDDCAIYLPYRLQLQEAFAAIAFIPNTT